MQVSGAVASKQWRDSRRWNGGWIIETKQALKKIWLAVLITLANGFLGWSMTGLVGGFFKVTTLVLLAVVIAASISLLFRARKKG